MSERKSQPNGSCFFFGEGFPLCGCGYPEEVLILIRDALEETTKGQARRSLPEFFGGDQPIHWLAAYALDAAGLLEHGSNIRYSWLTDKGRAALAFLREHGTDSDTWPDDRAIEWVE